MPDDLPDAVHGQSERTTSGGEGYPIAPQSPLDDDAVIQFAKPPLSQDEVKWIKDTLSHNDESEQRFSLAGLFGIVTAAAVVLAIGVRLPRPMFAGLSGFATLAGMVVLSLMSSPPFALRLAWWVLLGIYLLAMGTAIWG